MMKDGKNLQSISTKRPFYTSHHPQKISESLVHVMSGSVSEDVIPQDRYHQDCCSAQETQLEDPRRADKLKDDLASSSEAFFPFL